MRRGNFFTGAVNPSQWRPLRPGEPGYGTRQYVRTSVTKVTWKTQRLSVARYQTAKSGKTPKQRALENASNRTKEQRAAYRLKRQRTAEKKREYGRDVKIKEIRKLERTHTEKSVNKLTKKERDRLAYVAFQNKEVHEDFLAPNRALAR